MVDPSGNSLPLEAPKSLMEPREYHVYILSSFLIFSFVHHVASWLIFRNTPSYRALSRNKRMEWDSRVMSTLHATVVSILCVVALFKESQMWTDPFFAQGRIALMAMCISIGYFACDLISMPIYYDRKNMLIFTVHHLVAAIAFYLILHYRVGLFFGVYRLTTELSTPFTNQRWFYRKVGYTLDRRRVAMVSLIFSIFFAITRNLMILPYWAFVYVIFGSESHVRARECLPGLDFSWFLSSLILDALNIYWAAMVYPIGINAAIKLYRADWRTDFDRARDKLRDRFTSARRRAMNNELINRLRRSASFNRLQRAWEDFKVFPGEIRANDLFSMAMSARSSPIRRSSDEEGEDALGDFAKASDRLMNNHDLLDDETSNGLTFTFRRKRSLSNA